MRDFNGALREDAEATTVDSLKRLLRPRSVAIVGMSARPDSAGRQVLANLQANGFAGDIHLVGRSPDPIANRPCLPSIDSLPTGVDLAIFTLPANAVEKALQECVAADIGGAVLFASGFAETGEESRRLQERLGQIALDSGIALIGPNCIGFSNMVDAVEVGFLPAQVKPRLASGSRPAVALVGQSGGMLTSIEMSLRSRGVAISYMITTGNEAALGVAHFTHFLSGEERTGAIAIYAEQIKDPTLFLDAVGKAAKARKPVILLKSGRSERAKQAALSHTGALAGDYAVMQAHVEAAGGIVVEDIDELVDVTQVAHLYPVPPVKGLGVLSASGAFGALMLDSCERANLDVPALSAASKDRLGARLPSFVAPDNPLDLTTQVAYDRELQVIGARALAEDPAIGSILYSSPGFLPGHAAGVDKLAEGAGESGKPVVVAVWGEDTPIADEFLASVRDNGFPMLRSADRAVRAIKRMTDYGRNLAEPRVAIAAEPFPDVPRLSEGVQPEWRGKKILQAIGVPVPQGWLCENPEDAIACASQIGFPVALKAQASAIAHKTEAGALALGLTDAEAVRSAWRQLMENVVRAAPDVCIDGMLVERMAPKGLDLMIGAKRDPQWGPLLMLGLGGVWVEALSDVQLMPLDLAQSAVIERLSRLRTAKLLMGFRGSAAVDLAAVARCAAALARLMTTNPEIVEVDINPLVALPQGQGVVALDALIVAK